MTVSRAFAFISVVATIGCGSLFADESTRKQPSRSRNEAENKEWRVSMLRVAVKSSYNFIVLPTRSVDIRAGEGNQLLLIDLNIEARNGKSGRVNERLVRYKPALSKDAIAYLSGQMPKESDRALAALHTPADVDALKTQLFVSSEIKLEIGGKLIAPVWVDGSGYGCASYDGAIKTSEGKNGFDPKDDRVVFYSTNGMTAAWIQADKPVKVTVIFTVPDTLKTTALHFYDLPVLKGAIGDGDLILKVLLPKDKARSGFNGNGGLYYSVNLGDFAATAIEIRKSDIDALVQRSTANGSEPEYSLNTDRDGNVKEMFIMRVKVSDREAAAAVLDEIAKRYRVEPPYSCDLLIYKGEQLFVDGIKTKK